MYQLHKSTAAEINTLNARGGRVRKNLLGVVNVALPRIQAELYFTEKFAESGIEAIVWTSTPSE